jgi:hypothetical protein
MNEDPNDDHLRKGVSRQGRMDTSILVTIGLRLRHTGLGRASLTQKLARARLRPAPV